MEGSKFYRGVFWVIDGALLAYPFAEGVYAEGTARSGVTYNHKKLWEQLYGSRGKPYNYYLAAGWTRTTGGSRRST